MRSSVGFLLAALALVGLADEARAGETYHTCSGFIASVPATITTQGVWCLRQDLSTAMASGAGITVAANNVTIDCNGFKLGGLAAGPGSQAVGIHAVNRQNVTVRNCNVRGFLKGMFVHGGAGHMVEANRFDNNLHIGIHVSADSGEIRDNLVYDTGGRPMAGVQLGTATVASSISIGIAAAGAHVIGNSVNGMFGPATGPGYGIWGIAGYGDGIEIRSNRLRNLSTGAVGTSVSGIVTGSFSRAVIRDNAMIRGVAPGAISTWGIYGNANARCKDNFISNFGTAIDFCAAL